VNLITRILRRRSHYRATFEGDSGRAVLADLKRFCGGMTSPIVVSPIRQEVDPIATAVRIGRQEVFQRIVTHLHIDDAQLLNLKEEANHDE
jgi:hypothetical protein